MKTTTFHKAAVSAAHKSGGKGRLLSAFFLVPVLLLFAACGAQSADSVTDDPAKTSAVQLDSSAAESTADTTAASADAPEKTVGKTLIAYFSWSGNTEKLAQMIAEKTGGELFAVEPQTPYSEDYNTVVDKAKVEQNENARPAVATTVADFVDYDTVFIGYPNWWSDVPMVMLTFMESYDWSGKTVIPFCTSGGGGFGNGLSSIKASVGGATVLDGFHVNGSRVGSAQSDIDAWIDGLNLAE